MKNIITILALGILLLAGAGSAQDSTQNGHVHNQALFTLEKNNQQPFETQKIFKFTLLHERNMNLSIFDLNNNKVRTLVSKVLEPGVHNITWDGKDSEGKLVKSGVYRYCLKTQNNEQSHIIAYLR